jgi:hypothetical protein
MNDELTTKIEDALNTAKTFTNYDISSVVLKLEEALNTWKSVRAVGVKAAS